MQENSTYEQLVVGHLLQRQRELRDLLEDPNQIGNFTQLSNEMIEVNGKLIEFYTNTNHNP